MLDRVKESLFNIRRGEVEGASTLDLFCGSGSLGIEALSRGAESCVFVEQDPRLANLTQRNLERCHLQDRASVLQEDVHYLPELEVPGRMPAMVIFADPPYAMVNDPHTREELFQTFDRLAGTWMGYGALLVLHHEPMPYCVWPGTHVADVDRRVYGNSQLTFFRCTAGKPDE
jgi:16S rRNA (guanine(966)-N(2))-methyltransferase RsmD